MMKQDRELTSNVPVARKIVLCAVLWLVAPMVFAANIERLNISDQANGASFSPSLSADGRYVAFSSLASNLVADDNNMKKDIFVRDLQTGTTTLVSVSSNGAQADSQQRVAFHQP